MESCERATSDLFSAMSSLKGYWYSLVDLYDTSFYLSQLFGVSIDELLDVFKNIGFVKKFKKKGSQLMRFKFTNFINQNGLDELMELHYALLEELVRCIGSVRWYFWCNHDI